MQQHLVPLLLHLLPLLPILVELPGTEARVFATQMSPRVVETQYGKLRGVLVTLSNRNLPQVEAYFGLQYASLLGGELRFMPPTSTIEKWEGIRVALKFRPVCPQRLPAVEELERRMSRSRAEHFRRIIPFLERQQEECLNLNIYVPVRERGDTSLLPVVVFVHGETFDLGSGNAYDGSALSAYGQIIVITINYRVGILGFLSTGDGNAPGNYALLDQIAALRWVQENVRPFGGNRSDVTLLGHGHGAVLVNLLMISPVIKGRNLFQRAIVQSGTALSPWAIIADPLPNTIDLSDRLNCTSPTDNSPAVLLACLKRLPFEQLIAVTVPTTTTTLHGGPTFGPTVDRRSVLLSDIRASMADGATAASDRPGPAFGGVALLVGFASNDAASQLNDSAAATLSKEAVQSVVADFVDGAFSYHRQTIFEVLLHQYKDWEGVRTEGAAWNSLVELLGDALYAVPAVELGLYHSAAAAGRTTAKTFVYCFNFTIAGGRTDGTAGSSSGHGDELTYIFAAPLTDGIDPFPDAYAKSEKSFTENILRYWINFIKTGSPNDPSSPATGSARPNRRPTEATPDWPPFEAEHQEVMILEARSHSRRQFRAARLALWLNLIPTIHRPDDDCEEEDNRGLLLPADAPPPPLNQTIILQPAAPPPPPPPVRLHCPSTSADERRRTAVQRGQGLGPWPGPLVPSPSPPPTGLRPGDRRYSVPKTTLAAVLRRHSDEPPPTRASSAGTGTPAFPAPSPAAAGGSTDHGVALVSVVAVGCVLLAVNVLLFACVYRRKIRCWRQRRWRRKEQEEEEAAAAAAAAAEEAEEKGELTEERSYGVRRTSRTVGALTAESDIKCTHYLTPIPSHHHLYCQMTSLQNSFHTSP